MILTFEVEYSNGRHDEWYVQDRFKTEFEKVMSTKPYVKSYRLIREGERRIVGK